MDSRVATMLQAGLAAGSALLLVLGKASAQDPSTVPSITNTTTTPTPSGPDIVAIVVPIVVILVVLVVTGVLVFLFCVVKKKRQTEGTYRPSSEEQTGARSVEAPNALKLPKEERLI
ncbi:protein crumbs homolog 3a [Colossoma macropomum]|uniref:protein crumbs homolog 3a n=1 Tax=Colossoma macropomum TaxID=42526 RepID=UPI0018644044|nr:protein crumbs homolog 3a [Colossoma macropomum]XP_036423318.1 protein crumbs homolog 3a [Colossoma macropomum]